MKHIQLFLCLLIASIFLSGCVTLPPKDYTQFIQHQPKTILILPPRNLSAEMNANYSFYTQSAKSVAEMGYYVYPTVLVDQFFKQNGVLIADEMHEIPLEKLNEVFKSDAVLYINVVEYGTKYVVLSSNIIVVADAVLVDSKSGVELWRGRIHYNQQGSNGILEALLEQIINKLSDQAHQGAGIASDALFITEGQGLIKGPRHPEFGKPSS